MAGRSDHTVLRQLFRDWGRPLAKIRKAGGQTNRKGRCPYLSLTPSGLKLIHHQAGQEFGVEVC